jgi:hypothetical protein
MTGPLARAEGTERMGAHHADGNFDGISKVKNLRPVGVQGFQPTVK